MSVFLSDKNFDADFWGFQRYGEHMQQIHLQQKAVIQTCQDFLKEINHEQAEQLYQKIATVWSRITGGVVEGHTHEFGKMMACCHLDDPIVHRTILDFKEGRDSELNLKAATCEISENEMKIKGADAFETECRIYGPINARVSLAFRALNYAARRMPFSGNKLTEDNCPDYLKGLTSLISSCTEELQNNGKNACFPQVLIYQKGEYPNPFIEGLAKAKADKKRGVTGNCFDLSTCAQEYLLSEKTLEKVDLYGIKNGNHVFLVIGKNTGLPDDYSTWDKDVIVCDTWDRSIFPGSLILTHLTEFTNPQNQSLTLKNSNFFNVEDFRSRSSKPMPDIELLLQKFHDVPLVERLNLAQLIVEAIENLPFAHQELLENQGLSALLSQMCHLLGLPGSAFERVKNKNWLFNPQAGEVSEGNAFFEALERGDAESFKQCVEAGARPGSCLLYQSKRMSPECTAFGHAFSVAERTNNPELIRIAVKGGALPDDEAIDRSLYVSRKRKNFDLFQAVMDVGAKPSVDTFYCACLIAIKTNHIEYMRSVVNCGARSNGKGYSEALKHSIKTGNLDFILLALQAGATPCFESLKLSCEMTLKTGNLFFIKSLLHADPDVKSLIRYNLRELAKGNVISPELRQRLIELVGVNGRDFFLNY